VRGLAVGLGFNDIPSGRTSLSDTSNKTQDRDWRTKLLRAAPGRFWRALDP
jgi:hypothetical protein